MSNTPSHGRDRACPCPGSVMVGTGLAPVLAPSHPLRGPLSRWFVFPFLTFLLLAGILAGSAAYSARASSSSALSTLPHAVPSIIAHSRLLGPTDKNQLLDLSIGLRLRNTSALQSYLHAVTRPKSATYHHYLSPAMADKAFTPDLATYNALLHYLKSSGFTITHTYTHHLLIVFQGTVGLAEQVFHVTINNYIAPRGQSYYANANDPQFPATLIGVVQSITGLNNLAHFQHPPMPARHTALLKSSTLHPSFCPGPGSGYYLPNQFAAGYNYNGLYAQGYHGEGQTVALFEFDTYQLSDLQTYAACYGQSHASIQTIVSNGPVPSDDGIIEVELDAEVVLGMAPGLGQLSIYEASNDDTGNNAMFAQIVQDAPPVVSDSWGRCEADLSLDGSEAQIENNFLSLAVAQGQSVFVASGDSGSTCNSYYYGPVLGVEDPGSQPWVTAVGGTTLTLNYDNSYNSEVVWNGYGASGGGISQFWQEPSDWTNAPGVINSYSANYTCNAPSGSYCRETPDVSLDADPYTGYVINCSDQNSSYCQGSPWFIVGGTSAAAPMWAAFTALVNEDSLKHGYTIVGFLNSALYAISSYNYYSDFNDIIYGNNDNCGCQSGDYPTTPYYDLATGLGSLNAANLASDLLSYTGYTYSPTNTTWYFAEGSAGGGFQEYLTLQNPSTATANVTITYLIQNPAKKIIANYSVQPDQRQTIDVDKDVDTSPSGPHYSLAAIVTSNVGIVAERPMYFNAVGVRSGSDVLGATSPGTSYYFSEADSTQKGSAHYNTFLTMLNPSTTLTDHVTITYYTSNCQQSCPTETKTLGPQQRQTATPSDVNLRQKLAIAVTSDNPVVVERPMYFSDNIPNAGGSVSGAASEVGATAPQTDWLFAEGYTGGSFQEYYELANFGSNTANVTINLEYTNGSTQAITVQVQPFQFSAFDVNYANANPYGTCTPSPCQVTNSVSAEITSDNPIVADRLMYFHYGSTQGCTDDVGLPAPAQYAYSFAEGYTGKGFIEFLTLQNPTAYDVIVSVTLYTRNSDVLQYEFTVTAYSRRTLNINSILNPIAGGSVSMTVDALNGVIVAERPMYFLYGNDAGGSDVIGYTGN